MSYFILNQMEYFKMALKFKKPEELLEYIENLHDRIVKVEKALKIKSKPKEDETFFGSLFKKDEDEEDED